MNLYYTLLSLLLSSLVAAESLSFFGGSQRVLGDGVQIPGESPLEHCQPDFDDDILTIYRIDLKPNPPDRGQTLVIEARGKLREDVEEGAYVNLQVKYGLIRLVHTTADLCEQIKNVDLKCPLEKGEVVMTKAVDLPKEIPPGKYTVFADVFSVNDERITCLTAVIEFPR
ncbi:MAG: Phosphatidylglycerol/phosphatidylinositol transfer protein [Geoglossum umbratile]|nr:MAG: Phosphatidylglycerol/phosphatidylinositol transfer protein [Geoglossum umbratile]